MNIDVLRYLRCPVCGLPLAPAETRDTRSAAAAVRALRCPHGHSFDMARQGYVNLNSGRAPHTGDSADMVAARADFLAAGHYDFISVALAEAARGRAGRPWATPTDRARAATRSDRSGHAAEAYADLVVDAGAGTGRHLAAVLDALPAAVGLALDVSKPALRRAARAHSRAAAALCDTWGPLPLADRSAALLLDVFAPRHGAEFHRVLRPDGALLVVTPAADHLHELVGRLSLLRVDPVKSDRVAGSLAGHFDLAGQASHRRRLRLSRREVHTLVQMGPSAWHTDPVRLAERVDALPEPVAVTASVRLAIYHPR